MTKLDETAISLFRGPSRSPSHLLIFRTLTTLI